MLFNTAAIEKSYTKQPVPSNFITSNQNTKQQILWIGCSDSLILETECLEGLREEMFVYRNLGGLVVNGDLSTQSAIEWGVGLLKVDHVILCGHYGCAVVKGRTKGEEYGGWSKPISELHSLDDSYLSSHQVNGFPNKQAKEARFEELYVLAEVGWLKQQEIVKKAIQERGLQVHAFVYDKDSNVCLRLVEDELVNGNGDGSCL